MRRFAALAWLGLGLALPLFAQAAQPAIVYEWVMADLGADAFTANPPLRVSQRYIDLSILPPGDRRRTAAALSWLLNCYNRNGQIVRLRPVVDDYSVVAFALSDLADSEESYRQLWQAWEAAVLQDYVYHLAFVEAVTPPAAPAPKPPARNGKQASDDEPPAPADTAPAEPKTRRRIIDGGWVNPETAAAIRELTDDSLRTLRPTGVVLRCDSFLELSSTPPLYHQFADIPDSRSAWFERAGVTAETIQKRRAIVGAHLAISEVTGAPRVIAQLTTVYGSSLYLTLDNPAENIQPDNEPARYPLDVIDQTYNALLGVQGKDVNFRWVAEEHLALNKCDHLLGALFNAAGVRQDAAPQNIARDKFNIRDGVLRPLISCVGCHAQHSPRDQWVNPFADSLLLLNKTPLGRLTTFKQSDAIRLAEFHNERRVQLQAAFDRDRFFKATEESTADYQVPVEGQPVGMTPAQVSELLTDMLQQWSYLPQARDQFAIELGLEHPAEFVAAMLTPIVEPKTGGQIPQQDPTILWLCQPLADGQPQPAVLRSQLRSCYHDAALRLVQYQINNAAKEGGAAAPLKALTVPDDMASRAALPTTQARN